MQLCPILSVVYGDLQPAGLVDEMRVGGDEQPEETESGFRTRGLKFTSGQLSILEVVDRSSVISNKFGLGRS